MELYELSGAFCPSRSFRRCTPRPMALVAPEKMPYGEHLPHRTHARARVRRASSTRNSPRDSKRDSTRARMLVHVARRIADIAAQTHTLFTRQASRFTHTFVGHDRAGPIDVAMVRHRATRYHADITDVPIAGPIHHAARTITSWRDGGRRRRRGRRQTAGALAGWSGSGLRGTGRHDHAAPRARGLIAGAEIAGLKNRTR